MIIQDITLLLTDGDCCVIILATGIVQANLDDDRVRVCVESGELCFALSLSIHQATWLTVALADAINGALEPTSLDTQNVLPFRRH
jgi:hypothetical protein